MCAMRKSWWAGTFLYEKKQVEQSVVLLMVHELIQDQVEAKFWRQSFLSRVFWWWCIDDDDA